ncbi:MAG: efflux RND transporter periplasmic adaptor subunit [Spongiibacteraceae bacterium]
MSKRMMVLLLVTVVAFGGLFGVKWFSGIKMAEYFDNMPVPPTVVSATAAKADAWITEVTAVGSVAAVQGAQLTTAVPGIVDHIYFKNGSAVETGDVILTLDSATDLAQLKSLQAAERLAELERDRLKALWQSKSISKSELDQRQTQLEQAQANAAAQQARIDQKILRAPFAGRLGIRSVNIGQYVEAGDPLINLQSLDKVFIDFMLPEQRFSNVQAGMPVRAQMDALGDKVFEGEITAIEPMIDPDTRNFRVQATFTNQEKQLRPGMSARVSLNVGKQQDVVVVPRTAISYRPYGNSVYVLTPIDGKDAEGKQQMLSKQRFVRTGETRGDLIAIDEGLSVDEQVVTSGLLKLRSGANVSINNAVQPDANIAPTPDNG